MRPSESWGKYRVDLKKALCLKNAKTVFYCLFSDYTKWCLLWFVHKTKTYLLKLCAIKKNIFSSSVFAHLKSKVIIVYNGSSRSVFGLFFKKSFWAAAPKGSMTYAFTHMGNFLLLLLLLRTPPPPSLQAHISASRPISQPWGPNPCLEAQIPTPRSKS